MKILFANIVCFSLSALVAAPEDAAKIDGGWTATGGSDAGKQIPPGTLDKLKLVVVFKEPR